MRRVPRQHFHRIGDALAAASEQVGVVLLAHAGGLGFPQYAEPTETIQNRPEVHRRARGVDDAGFRFNDGNAHPGLRETEGADHADRPAPDDYHVLHRASLKRADPGSGTASSKPIPGAARWSVPRETPHGAITILLCTPLTPSVSFAISSARSLASFVGTVPLSQTMPSRSVFTFTLVSVVGSLAKSLVFTLVVIAESLTYMPGYDASESAA